jgi:pcfG
MVVTKVFQIKNSNKLKQGVNYIDDKEKISKYDKEENGLDDKIDYIVDENKTNRNKSNDEKDWGDVIFFSNKEYVSAYGLTSPKYAFEEMMMTKMQAKQILGSDRQGGKVDVLAHHIIQSFSPEDNLTPEEVHEIGRKTVLELTGGEHEFIIATHLDKNHMHNHIIFNTTNNVTLKKFRWQKGTKKSLENISDKYADLYGAKILDRDKIISHKKYEAYKKQNTFRYEIKQKLNFLLKNSNSVDDFIKKAKLLGIEVNTEGKEVKYKLLNGKQQRNVRDRTLSKKGYYSFENINKMTAGNKKYISKEKIKEMYENHKQEKEENFEMRFVVEPWQVLEETKRGIYVEVEFGISNKGIVLVPYTKIDKIDRGYEVFIKSNDYFYFLNEGNSKENRYIKGTTLAKQLSKENGEEVVYKNYYISKMEKLIEEFNYLSTNRITNSDEFKDFQERFIDNLEKTNIELIRLDTKIAELNKLHSALLGVEEGSEDQKRVAEEILGKLKISRDIKIEDIEKLLNEVKVERDILNIKYKETINEYNYSKNIEKNIKIRETNRKLDNNKDGKIK